MALFGLGNAFYSSAKCSDRRWVLLEAVDNTGENGFQPLELEQAVLRPYQHGNRAGPQEQLL
ncbi:hypothetical protein BRAO375_1270003 [Bradyrhizobium sp. ORS 375]|uniref:hypothetical protein n=1 Tax=Bradyrhizobium sp. (strain ORS 375) TaxID=566679 RepID=UPI000240853D|nr:hypothetical protein [Bradyrhizobium sp. ORS 375]CCD90926.1 hypothetical protein BRAO375_1270003 [Bradyrhizobium sp. ORS 375]